MRTVSRFVDYTFEDLRSRYDLRTTNLDDSKICIYKKNELKAFVDDKDVGIKRIKFITEVEEQEAFNIASLCSAVLHSAVMF